MKHDLEQFNSPFFIHFTFSQKRRLHVTYISEASPILKYGFRYISTSRFPARAYKDRYLFWAQSCGVLVGEHEWLKSVTIWDTSGKNGP